MAALCLSACGGAKQSAPPPPALSHSLGASLAARSDAVASALAAGDSCRARTLARQLQQRTIAAINEGHVAAGLQEQLLSAVNALVAGVQCVPPPPPQVGPRHDHGKHKGRDKKNEDDRGN
ncbi:MAG TPA: hypothetical protein VLB89_04975 [Gaiellaceae bacterium]|nr:hypothetical protein [Gaiellaceae bacterium]